MDFEVVRAELESIGEVQAILEVVDAGLGHPARVVPKAYVAVGLLS